MKYVCDMTDEEIDDLLQGYADERAAAQLKSAQAALKFGIPLTSEDRIALALNQGTRL